MTDKNQPILITGAAGFIGKNLTARLTAMGYTSLLLFDKDTNPEKLPAYAASASFVFHLAGVNRPKDPAEFYSGNAGLTGQLLAALQTAGNKAPLVLSSSAQAGNGSDYAKSKEEAEAAVFAHGETSGSPVAVFRFPGVFGKWCRPGYNSVVATFCHNIANGQPIEVRDPSYSFPLVFIDDVVDTLIALLEGRQTFPPLGKFAGVEPVYPTTLGTLAGLVQSFKASRETLAVPDMADLFTQKLYATYLSYLPEGEFAYPLKMNVDDRGSFTEFLRTQNAGQVSVNVAKPGITKGQHWHDTKNEKFLVVSGKAAIRFRRLGSGEVIEYVTSGEEMQVVDIPTGYTHNIENIGDTDLVTVMWASAPFDLEKPDTWFEPV